MILFEDKDIIVCHKPAGIPVQSARIGQKDMVSILNNYLAEKQEAGRQTQKQRKNPQIQKGRKEPGTVKVVHRLDQPVEGVLVFAKTKRAASELGKQITEGNVKKTYQAVCCVTGKVLEQEWYEDIEKLSSGGLNQNTKFSERTYQLIDYLVKDGRTNISSVTDKGKKDAKRAELSFRILDMVKITEKKYVLAEINLKTGRHHQIRVQMAHAGLPLYGDRKYNSEWENYQSDIERFRSETLSENFEVSGSGKKAEDLALCAVSLGFFHPVTGKYMTFEVKPEAEIFGVFCRE